MTQEEYLRQLEEARTSILVGGQSYQIGNRRLTRADLSRITAEIADIKAQIASGTSGEFLENTYVAVFDGR
jgi:hypothetical protein